MQHTDEEIDAYLAEQAAAEDTAHVVHYGIVAAITYWLAEEAQEAAYARCLVQAFHDDPITRQASLDADEQRPMVDSARMACQATGCVLCNQTWGCYFCHQDQGGDVMEQDSSKLPQRRVRSERTVNPGDPTTALTLECSHTII